MFMKIVLPLALLLCAGAAEAGPIASTATATAPAKPQPATAAAAAKRFPGVSDAGNAILAKAQTTADPQMQTINKQARAAHDQLMAAVMAPMIDVDKVTAALRAEEAAQSEARTHSNDRLIAVLKQLPDEDKGNFLRTLVLSRQTRPAAATPPAPGGN
jgi:uncharacterized membrane protein